MSFFSGAVTDIEGFFSKIEADIKGVDWTAVTTYWTDFMKGLSEAVAPLEALFPATKPALDNIVAPIMADANQAVVALLSTVQGYQAGTLSAADLTSMAQTVNSAVTAANVVVGQAIKGQLGNPAPSAPAVAVVPVVAPAVVAPVVSTGV